MLMPSVDDLKIRVAGQFIKNWANNSPIPAVYLHAHWMPACLYGSNTGSTYMDYCKILPCGAIIGNQGGRQDVSKGEKATALHNTFLCVTKQGLASVLSLLLAGFLSAAPTRVVHALQKGTTIFFANKLDLVLIQIMLVV